MTTSLAIAIAVLVLVSLRQWLPARIRIWHLMAFGAGALLLLGEISPQRALSAVDWNVIAYLFGVFSIGRALYESGLPHRIADRLCRDGRPTTGALVRFSALVTAIALVLTNDAAAIIGTPVALVLAARLGIAPAGPLIALCAFVTVGSLASPVGSPQNILITAFGRFENPLATYACWLAVPMLVSLIFCIGWFRFCLARTRPIALATFSLPDVGNARAWPAWLATLLLALFIAGDSLLPGWQGIGLPLGALSVIACAPVFLFGRGRCARLRAVDWPTLGFFVGLFIVTGAVQDSGALQTLLSDWQTRLAEPAIVTAAGFGASQLFSNVPVVAIYLHLLGTADAATLMLLAGTSTLAGNLFVISAASNVIVVQQAESFGARPFDFWQFTLWVLPVTVVSMAACLGWILFVLPSF